MFSVARKLLMAKPLNSVSKIPHAASTWCERQKEGGRERHKVRERERER